MNIGILGGGNISDTHARAAAAIPGVTVVAFCGANRDRTAKLAARHEAALYDYVAERLTGVNWLRVLGEAPGKGAILSFTVNGAHAHDVAQILDRYGVAVRAGSHCAEPLMKRFGLTSSARMGFM